VNQPANASAAGRAIALPAADAFAGWFTAPTQPFLSLSPLTLPREVRLMAVAFIAVAVVLYLVSEWAVWR